MASLDKDKLPAISFYKKKEIHCPYCKKKFKREEILSGGGRMIAGDLTDELHRTYEPSPKFGKVYPLLYPVCACPHCQVALLWQDFDVKPEPSVIRNLIHTEQKRKSAVNTIFPYYNLDKPRKLYDGAAMYYLALLSYEQMPASFLPTIKRAIISLRLAWITKDLDAECPNRGFDYISQRFYRKALFFYDESLIREQAQKENLTGLANLGPDIDKNYGYDGVIYLCGLLEFKYGQREDINARIKKLDNAKHAIARSFGLGKSTKAKPGPLLEHSRALYDNINKELKEAETLDLDLDLDFDT
ncbi:MAG: hypothetical protein BKP49_09315 [Treponema sp. CETP13]|nr:MAG: hypothetical protein BKP49_09315 [Treponema sp. CETP13]